MRPSSRVITYFAAVTAFATAATPASAASPPPEFDGSCELSGTARFDHPVTNTVESNGGTFRSSPGLGNCIGTLSAGGRPLDGSQWQIRAKARAKGDFSCLNGSLSGRASMLFLDGEGDPLRVDGRRVKIRARIAMAHAVAAGSIEFLGGRGTSAGGAYNFTPSGGAVAGCAQGGDESLPMTVRMSTRGAFVGLRRHHR